LNLKEEVSGKSAGAVAEDRRRSQRVMLRVAISAHLKSGDTVTTIEGHTLVVNTHGAMLCMPQNVPAETHFELEHKRTRERKRARVTRKPQSSPEGWLVPVEFEEKAEDFWHVSFPPPNWKPPID
jgi:hypothetical protein